MNPEKLERIEGYFLSFTSEECADINKYLEDCDYPPGTDGLKKLILDIVYSEDVEEEAGRKRVDGIVGQVNDFLNKNPQVVSIAGNVISGLLKKKRPV